MIEGEDVLSIPDVLKQTGAHFARSKKIMKDKQRLEGREAERYSALAKKVSYSGPNCGFVYHPTFRVGESMYQFLAQPKIGRKPRRGGKRGGRHVPRLKLFIPDTLVFNTDDEPLWYYTDKRGFVACVSPFEAARAVEQLGDVRYEGDIAAVRKQSYLLPVRRCAGGDDPSALYSSGNTISLANTRDIRQLTGAAAGKEGEGSAPPIADNGEPFVLQKFIKSRGPHAFIVRQVMEDKVLPTAWIISNRQAYGEEMDPQESLLLARAPFVGRFVTTPTSDRGCSITRLGPRACGETAEAAGRVWRHLEAVLEKRLQVLVCDFTKDDRGRLWFLQIKAFRFLGYPPGRPFKLTVKARHAAICRLRGRSSSSTPLTTEGNGTVAGEISPAPHEPETRQAGKDDAFCREGRERSEEDGVDSRASSLDGDGNDRPRGSGPRGVWGAHDQDGRVTGRLVACGMCGASLSPADVGMRMTQKMVRETLRHIWSRMPQRQVPRCLRDANRGRDAAIVANGDNEGTAVPAASWEAAIRRRPSSAGYFDGENGRGQFHAGNAVVAGTCRFLRDLAVGIGSAGMTQSVKNTSPEYYLLVRACKACFALHQTEASLMRAERRLAVSVGAIKPAGMGGEGGEENPSGIPHSRAGDAGLPSAATTECEAGKWGQSLSRTEACEAVHPTDLPDELDLCRLLVAISELVDVPVRFLKEASARGFRLQLRYDFLGRRQVIPLKNPVASEHGSRGYPEEVGSPQDARRQDKLCLLVKSFRVFSFLQANCPPEASPRKGVAKTALDGFVSDQRDIVVSLRLVLPRGKARRARKERGQCTGNGPGGARVTPPTVGTPGKRRRRRSTAGGGSEKKMAATSSVGEARLGLTQFGNERIRKVELQAPLVLNARAPGTHASLLLVKAYLGLERVRKRVGVETLPRPLFKCRGVFVGGRNKSAEDFHTCDPLPDSWLQIGRTVKAVGREDTERGSEVAKKVFHPDITLAGVGARRDASAGISRAEIMSEEAAMEECSSCVWGLCVSISKIHRPEGIARTAAPDAGQTEATGGDDDDMATGNLFATGTRPPAPPVTKRANLAARMTASEGRRGRGLREGNCRLRCSLFGYSFGAGHSRDAGKVGRDSFGRGVAPPTAGELHGAEIHAYLQCGLERLRRAMQREGKGNDKSVCALEIETLDPSNGVRGADKAGCSGPRATGGLAIFRCEVPLGTLADDRCMEGTFPLVPVPVGDDAPEKNLGHEEDGLQANGTVVPGQRCSIELAVYLYRMGPHSVPRDGDVQSWRPPSLLEKGRICCGDGPITLFERAPVLDE